MSTKFTVLLKSDHKCVCTFVLLSQCMGKGENSDSVSFRGKLPRCPWEQQMAVKLLFVPSETLKSTLIPALSQGELSEGTEIKKKNVLA